MARKKKEVILSVCTSGGRLKLGLAAGGRSFALSVKEPNQEKRLFPSLEELLGKARAGLGDITEVRAVRGPGRFTGIRIGLTLARSLELLLGCRARGVTVFETLALAAAPLLPAGGKLAVLLHAFKEEYFVQFYRVPPGGKIPKPLGAPVWLPEAGARELLSSSAPDLCVADAEEKPGIYSLAPAGCPQAPARLSLVTPAAVCAAGAVYGAAPEPLYLKPAKYELDAKAKARGRGK
ncbi:MAG TPA: tRNA (adenosine(37)-N6)-threonylcarbamoyltransferase complex dimerization subunit type 1 TsaB [Elusimicrobiales bacterium]|nr:tRNA (adenosine(37)-N6)-threonylcarbamoyltransferase complex dimerization subunit type 1 TsaB [Elusimicrobiales bacterium]